MANFTWGSSMPSTGALKTSTVSKKLYLAAIAECVFVEHVTPENGFGLHKGQSITIPSISNLTESSDQSLAEQERIPERSHTVTGTVITISEFGEAVPMTSFAQDLSVFDLKNSVQMKLKDNMRLALDARACRAFKASLLKYTPTSATAASTATNGTAPTAATANMNVYHAAAIRDLLFDTYKAPTADGDMYVGIFRTLGLRGIKNDPDWEVWHQYLSPQAKYNSEVGKLEGIRFIETNHGGSTVGSAGLNTGIGTSAVLGEGVVFGKDAVCMIEVLTPELREGIPQDFGRSQSVAWYGMYEFGLRNASATAGLARCIHVTST